MRNDDDDPVVVLTALKSVASVSVPFFSWCQPIYFLLSSWSFENNDTWCVYLLCTSRCIWKGKQTFASLWAWYHLQSVITDDFSYTAWVSRLCQSFVIRFASFDFCLLYFVTDVSLFGLSSPSSSSSSCSSSFSLTHPFRPWHSIRDSILWPDYFWQMSVCRGVFLLMYCQRKETVIEECVRQQMQEIHRWCWRQPKKREQDRLWRPPGFPCLSVFSCQTSNTKIFLTRAVFQYQKTPVTEYTTSIHQMYEKLRET